MWTPDCAHAVCELLPKPKPLELKHSLFCWSLVLGVLRPCTPWADILDVLCLPGVGFPAIRLSHKCSRDEDGAGPQGFLGEPEASQPSDTLSLGPVRGSDFISGF